MNQLYPTLQQPAQFEFQAQTGLDPLAGASAWSTAALEPRRTADGVRTTALPDSFRQNALSGSPFSFAGFPGFGQIAQLIQQLMAMLQGLFTGQSGQGEPQYADATASSTGDPHLAFNATRADGTAQAAHFDSMTSHADLLDSGSFQGGYRIATQVTAPAPNGTTMNQSATITSNDGQTSVSLDNAGAATITQSGQLVAISAGQTLDLGNGETVTKNADGSLSVITVNGAGGTINTLLKANGGGVDVTTHAHNVALGGDLTTQGSHVHPYFPQEPLLTPRL